MVLDALYEGLRNDRDRTRCYAVVACVRLGGADAVRVELEHADGIAITVALPYQIKGRFSRKVEYGDLRGGTGEHRLWEPRT